MTRIMQWCEACREVGMLHCAHPEECDGMRSVDVKELQDSDGLTKDLHEVVNLLNAIPFNKEDRLRMFKNEVDNVLKDSYQYSGFKPVAATLKEDGTLHLLIKDMFQEDRYFEFISNNAKWELNE